MSLVDKCVLLFLLAGHVLVPLVFLIIIFFMKRKNSKGNRKPIPWTALLIVQAVLDFTILPFWMFMGVFVGIMTTDAPGSSTLFANASMFGSIATVILNVIALIITTAGLNKQRVEENKQPLMWLYVIIAAYVLVVPGRFFIGSFF
ncbi:hypothetical protein HMPREF0433_00911 [Gemella sanguinis M325]|uniref:Uncharacterized protein n=1 Tax=Gemella sanguinis TaxID=84135 RepID=A0ABX6FFH2_9BACL|nr:hypothetical protein [Gemella sanguinis]EGF87726.1 hypothetical protein HMPREF0433_00911 [Gemella sanguinis M325]QGS06893.1 hypothetical protein FOC50_00660 [Gemella sanguinis]